MYSSMYSTGLTGTLCNAGPVWCCCVSLGWTCQTGCSAKQEGWFADGPPQLGFITGIADPCRYAGMGMGTAWVWVRVLRGYGYGYRVGMGMGTAWVQVRVPCGYRYGYPIWPPTQFDTHTHTRTVGFTMGMRVYTRLSIQANTGMSSKHSYVFHDTTTYSTSTIALPPTQLNLTLDHDHHHSNCDPTRCLAK